jgi:hypothetical protein
LDGNEGGAAQEVRETVCKSSNGSGKQMKVCSKNYHEITKHFILFITNKWSNELECYITLALKGLLGDKHFNLLGH